MAIDTDAKKMSAMLFGFDHVILPTATIVSADMQDLLGLYRGIAAAELVRRMLYFGGERPAVSLTGKRPSINLTGVM